MSALEQMPDSLEGQLIHDLHEIHYATQIRLIRDPMIVCAECIAPWPCQTEKLINMYLGLKAMSN